MSVFELRFFTPWGVRTADVDQIVATSVTLPPLGGRDRAIATRIDGDRQQLWWDGVAWREGAGPERPSLALQREESR